MTETLAHNPADWIPTNDELLAYSIESAECHLRTLEWIYTTLRSGKRQFRVSVLAPWRRTVELLRAKEIDWRGCEICGGPIKTDAEHMYDNEYGVHWHERCLPGLT